MLDTDDLELWYALNRLIANYWADVDHNGGRQAHEFYLPEALYAVGNNRFEGTEKIRAFYARRRQHGNITTRHLVGNVRVFRDDAPGAGTVGVMTLFRADGRPPFLKRATYVTPPYVTASDITHAILDGRQPRDLTAADSGGSRPRIRDDVASFSEGARRVRPSFSTSCRHRSWSSLYCSVKQYHPDNSSMVIPKSV